jgi:predicted ATP-grasp superfamily ATP-dependent carboligase
MVAMVSHSKKLIAELAWSGPIMVEWKFDTKEGLAKLMEINGRFWGSLPLPERAGVQFVLGYDVLARGFAAPKARPVHSLTTQHFLGDVRWLWRVMTAKDPLRAALYPRRLSAVGAFLKTTFTVPGDVFSLLDPLPFFMEYIDVIKKHV